MTKKITFHHPIIVFGLPLLMLLFSIFLTKTISFSNNPSQLSFAITADLLATVPLLYLALIWKTEIPKYTAISAFIIGLIAASYIIPTEHQSLLSIAKTFILPLLELGIFAVITLKFRAIVKKFKSQSNVSLDFYDTLKIAANEVLPKKIAALIVTEAAVIYYAFFGWKKQTLEENEFTIHRRSGSREMLGAFSFIILIETFAMHMAIHNWSNTLAWILTFLSIYTGLQVFALIRSLPKRPIKIEGDKVHLRYGFICETTIDIANIDSIEFSRKADKDNDSIQKLSILGDIDTHNTLIHLKEEATITRIYGIQKKYRTLSLHVDEKEQFKNRIETTAP